MDLNERFPEVLIKIIKKFLEKYPSVNEETFMKILSFVYKEGDINGQNKYLTTKTKINEK
jgi:hypothetical protein